MPHNIKWKKLVMSVSILCGLNGLKIDTRRHPGRNTLPKCQQLWPSSGRKVQVDRFLTHGSVSTQEGFWLFQKDFLKALWKKEGRRGERERRTRSTSLMETGHPVCLGQESDTNWNECPDSWANSFKSTIRRVKGALALEYLQDHFESQSHPRQRVSRASRLALPHPSLFIHA